MISVKSFSLEKGGKSLFENQNLNVPSGFTAVMGPNGAGKSSFLRSLAGEEEYRGKLVTEGGFALLAQAEERPDRKVEEWIAEIWSRGPEEPELISGLIESLRGEDSCRNLSGGEWLRLRLARKLSENPRILALDEPSNHLDRAGRNLLKAFFREWKGSLLLVSHDRELLFMADRVLEVQPGSLRLLELRPEEYLEEAGQEKERSEARLDEARRKRRKEEKARHEKKEAQEKRMARGQRIADRGGLPRIIVGGLKRQAQVSLGRIDRETSERVQSSEERFRELWLSQRPEIRMRLDPEASIVTPGRLIFHGEDLNPQLPGRGPLWSRGLSLTLRGPGRWVVRGGNGRGKSLLVNLIGGRASQVPFSGAWTNPPLEVSFLNQERSLNEEQSLIDWIREEIPVPEDELRTRLADFGFFGPDPLRSWKSFSGGEKVRASLARLLFRGKPPELLILDEPTNDLDLANLEALEEALKEYPGALLVISHDEPFVKALGAELLVDLDDLVS